jgi:hypothetical protein
MSQTGLINYKLLSVTNQEAEDEPSEEQETTREEWMILSDLNTPFDNSKQTPESTYNWHLSGNPRNANKDENKQRGIHC